MKMNIRETILIMTSVAMTALSACEPIASDRFGFDLPVGPRSGGINNVEVNFTVSAIRLTGNIIASEGALVAEIMSPSGAVVFSASVEAPGEVHIDKSLPVEEGEWRMRYFSLNGKVVIRMHLNLVR